MSDKTIVAGELPVFAYETSDQNGSSMSYAAWFHRYGNPLPDDAVPLVLHSDATAALAQKDGEIERTRTALRELVERYEEICRAKDPSYSLDDDALTNARAALGSQA